MTKWIVVLCGYPIVRRPGCMCCRPGEVDRTGIRCKSCQDTAGKQESPWWRVRLMVSQMYYVSILFFVIALGMSKLSVAFLLLRLTPQQQQRRVFQVIVALITVWTIASTVAVALQCNLSHPWILIQESCPRAVLLPMIPICSRNCKLTLMQFLRWQVISAFDIAFELCLLGMSIYLVWGLRTSLENKITVVISFGMRLP